MRTNTLPDEIIGEWRATGDYWQERERNPLKGNALKTLRPEFSKLGFATGPVQRRASFFRLPIHWVHPSNREARPFARYESVAAVTVPCLDDSAVPQFAYTVTCAWRHTFGQFFDRFLEAWELDELFSDVGLAEIRRFVRAVKTGKRCAEPAKIVRYEWVKSHPELWNDLPTLLAEMRRFKLYSSTTPKCQALGHLRAIVDQVRSGKGAEDFEQAPQSRPSWSESALPEVSWEDFMQLNEELQEKFASMPRRRGRGPSKGPLGPLPSQ